MHCVCVRVGWEDHTSWWSSDITVEVTFLLHHIGSRDLGQVGGQAWPQAFGPFSHSWWEMPSCEWEVLRSLLEGHLEVLTSAVVLFVSRDLEHGGPSWEHPQKTPREERVQLITKPNCCVPGLCASTPHTSAHLGATWADCNYINYAGRAAAGQEGGAPFPGCFPFLEQLLAWAHRQAVGTEACAGVPIRRATR